MDDAERSEGDYVMLEDEELDAVGLESTRIINIAEPDGPARPARSARRQQLTAAKAL